MTAAGYRPPSAPRKAGPAGRRLWRSITTEFELAEHELTILREAVRGADTCADLQDRLDEDGLSPSGKPHWALAELRLQRIVLTRMIVALRVPLADDDSAHQGTGEGAEGAATGPEPGSTRPQRRGTRGVYGIRGAVS